ncbi:MAG TPA: hypothetical protein PLA27_14050 [Anaerolineales bacterium]|nr:hypothetical protein [Anaerolineales bacterium]HQX17542.1 hypothetical protein [Anaerolineales bacterium]
MNTFEGTQVIANIGPHAFSGIRVNFSEAIPVIVTRPFMIGMTNNGMVSKDVIVRLPFVSVASCLFQRELVNMLFKRFSVGMMNHT